MSTLLTDIHETNKNNKCVSLIKIITRKNKMAKEPKDKSNLYIGGIILFAIIGVLLLKQDETKHLGLQSQTTEASQAAFDVANEKRLRTQNVFVD